MPKAAIHNSGDLGVLALVLAVIRDDAAEVARLLGQSPSLARESLDVGATRQGATDFFFKQINHYVYSGDTPLHAAAAGYRKKLAQSLIKNGAEVRARNRRGDEPLHYAADGGPGAAGGILQHRPR
jgi:ankyrin repeat protein